MTDVRACVCLWRVGGLVGLPVAWPLTLGRGAVGRAAWGVWRQREEEANFLGL